MALGEDTHISIPRRAGAVDALPELVHEWKRGARFDYPRCDDEPCIRHSRSCNESQSATCCVSQGGSRSSSAVQR